MNAPAVLTGAPEYRGPFVGRTAEIRALVDLVAETGALATIVGAPGIGKTRLAAEVSRLSADRPVWFVPLLGVRTVEGLCLALARALDVEGVSSIERLARRLDPAERPLVVLDNAEELALADALTSLRARAALLVTSRRELGLAGERVVELGSLSMPASGADLSAILASEAGELFFSRTRFRHGVGPREDEAPLWAAVLTALGGNPLAIDLCARRAPLLGPAGLLEGLSERLSLLSSREPVEGTPYGSLEAALDASWDRLDDAERLGWARLSVFSGGADIEAARAVLGSGDVLDLLASFAERSLLSVVENAAFGRRCALDQNLRDYAARRLRELGDEERSFTAHARSFAERYGAWPDVVDGPRTLARRARLLEDAPNLIVVLERNVDVDLAQTCVAALTPIALTQGPAAEHVALLERAVSLGGESRGAACAWIGLGRAEAQRGHLDRSVRAYERAAQIAERTGEPRLAAYAAIKHAGTLAFLEPGSPAIEERFEEAQRRTAELADPWLEAQLCEDRGIQLMHGEENERARPCLERALLLFRECADEPREAFVLANLSFCALELGLLDAAKRHAEEAITRLEKLGQRRWCAHTRTALALAFYEQGDVDRARQELERARTAHRSLGDERLEAVAGVYLATIELERGRAIEAAQLLDRALEILEAFGDREKTAFGWSARAIAAAELEDPERARLCLARAEQRAREGGYPALVEVVAVRRAHVEGLLGTGTEAIASVLERHPGQHITPHELRLAVSALRRRFGAGSLEALRVAEDAAWFEIEGERVDLARSRRLRKVLARLLDERLARPGAAISLHDLYDAGWAGERASPESSANRVYVCVSRLRKAGLSGVLLNDGEGFLLDPRVPIERKK